MKLKKYARISICFSLLAFAPSARIANAASDSSAAASETVPSIAFGTLDIGAESGCVRAAKMMISSEAEWQRVWKLHTTTQEIKTSAPPVDFEKQSVVALLSGTRSGGASIQIVQVVPGAASAATTVYYAQTPGWKEAKTASQPFHFAVVPKIEGALRFADANQECIPCVVR